MPLTDVLVAQQSEAGIIKERPAQEIIYPDSDGAPMGETEYHVTATLHLYDALRHFFKNVPDVYVAADMFMYYKQGDPRANKAPDVMVIKGVPKHKRRSFKVWEEQAVPCVIFEVTSKSTMVEDTIHKSILYAALGVREYFIFDPLKEYLDTGLAGFGLEKGESVPLEADNDGVLFSQELNVFLTVQDEMLRIIDPQTHRPVPALEEAISNAEQEAQRAGQEAQRAEQEAQRAEQEAQRAEQEAQRAEQAEQLMEAERQRADEAEAELTRLRTLLENT